MWMNTGQEKAKGKIEDKYFLFLTVNVAENHHQVSRQGGTVVTTSTYI